MPLLTDPVMVEIKFDAADFAKCLSKAAVSIIAFGKAMTVAGSFVADRSVRLPGRSHITVDELTDHLRQVLFHRYGLPECEDVKVYAVEDFLRAMTVIHTTLPSNDGLIQLTRRIDNRELARVSDTDSLWFDAVETLADEWAMFVNA